MKQNALRWPGGKARALTFSWDDGVTQDRRLLELMRRFGLKGTFNLNSGMFGHQDSIRIDGTVVDHSHVFEGEVALLYAGQEVAVHTVTHPNLNLMPGFAVRSQIAKDRDALERITGAPVRGMAYPFGKSSARVRKIAAFCGMCYARGIEETHDFSLPQTPMDWACTCHYRDMGRYIDAFLSEKGIGGLFSIWGHSYELDPGDEWDTFAEQLQRLSGREDIWYATNGEVFDYLAETLQ